MIFVNRFFSSRLGRRIFFMFFISALLPLTGISLFSFKQVVTQLRKQCLTELKQSCEIQAMILHGQLLALEKDLLSVAASWDQTQAIGDRGLNALAINNETNNRFKAIFFSQEYSQPIIIKGKTELQADAVEELFAHPDSARTTIVLKLKANKGIEIFLLVSGRRNHGGGRFLGQVNSDILFNDKFVDMLPAVTQITIIDQNRQIVFSTLPDVPDISALGQQRSGTMTAAIGDQSNIFQYLSMFLEGHFDGSSWFVLLNRSRQEVFRPVKVFLYVFILSAIAAFLLILLFSLKFIQKSLIPLEKLQEGTRQIVERNFGYRVESSGQDEFSDLAHAFNQMSGELELQFNALQEMSWGALMALSRMVDAKSPWTAGHSIRVSNLALAVAMIMQLPPDQIDNIKRAGLLHDLGKIGIPVDVLDKSSQLSDEEFSQIRTHPEIGARIIEPIKAYECYIPAIIEHHERFDGKGYPFGKKGYDISLDARILAVADVYDACTYDRPYRKGMLHDQVITIITEQSGSSFDPEVVKAFMKVDFLQLKLKNCSLEVS